MTATQTSEPGPLRPVPDTLSRSELEARGDAFLTYVRRNGVRTRGEAWRLVDTLFPGMSSAERDYVYDRGRGETGAAIEAARLGSDV